jgi:uncharacterized protein (TIGR02145 family)
VYIYSPVIRTNAESESGYTDVSIDIKPVIAIRSDLSELALESSVNNFVSGDVNIDVLTNSKYGYTLSLEDEDDDTRMVATANNVTSEIISEFSDAKTSATMPDNTWGYSLDSTNFYKIPKQGESVVIDRSETPSPSNPGYDRTMIKFGIKVGKNLTSGTYADTVRFTAYTNGQDAEQVVTMQNFTCDMLPNEYDSMVIADTRDGNEYTVKKMKDGRCWMVDDLKTFGITINSADSDLPDGVTYTLPNENTMESFEFSDIDATFIYHGSGFYNFYTATAGWGKGSISSGDSPQSICPKGWRLPTGGYNSEYDIFADHTYYLSLESEANFTFVGEVQAGELYGDRDEAHYWSSTVIDSGNAYAFYADRSGSTADYAEDKYYGSNVRCIAAQN